ncbi:hypothetical protein [Anaerovorax sp. IOR16]|uniref:hypothetical protein n=1 Tax=Anaerovorax sp. IOR16 TaxID=2773458 RepID=UPI0019D31F98|nr:hypothetical protein [Anaerovorax sp. IOR16]
MFELEELEKFRTIEEMNCFYKMIYEFIENDDKFVKEARLKDKRFAYKELFEEYLPLLHYAEIAYSRHDVKCRYVGRLMQSQKIKYNGEVLFPNGRLEKIEISVPREGEKEKKDTMDLDDIEYTRPIVCDINQKWEEIRQIIVTTAIKKSKSNYTDVTIVFSFEFCDVLFTSKNHTFRKYSFKKIEELANDLRAIKYSAKKVYLLIPPFGNDYKGEIITIS